MVVEGVNALSSVRKLSKKYSVEMPIVSGVNVVIKENADPAAVVKSLLERSKIQNYFVLN